MELVFKIIIIFLIMVLVYIWYMASWYKKYKPINKTAGVKRMVSHFEKYRGKFDE